MRTRDTFWEKRPSFFLSFHQIVSVTPSLCLTRGISLSGAGKERELFSIALAPSVLGRKWGMINVFLILSPPTTTSGEPTFILILIRCMHRRRRCPASHSLSWHFMNAFCPICVDLQRTRSRRFVCTRVCTCICTRSAAFHFEYKR